MFLYSKHKLLFRFSYIDKERLKLNMKEEWSCAIIVILKIIILSIFVQASSKDYK